MAFLRRIDACEAEAGEYVYVRFKVLAVYGDGTVMLDHEDNGVYADPPLDPDGDPVDEPPILAECHASVYRLEESCGSVKEDAY